MNLIFFDGFIGMMIRTYRQGKCINFCIGEIKVELQSFHVNLFSRELI